jgi:copper chaperone CopZ
MPDKVPAANAAALENPVRYRITGMDCPDCAEKIEGAGSKVPGVDAIKVSIASQVMTLWLRDMSVLPDLERVVTDLGYQVCRLQPEGGDGAGLSHVTPAYRRALWIVVLLNAGYGVVEIVGGFLAGSQSLKADALDFIGDGLISLIGLLAIGWGFKARAQAALLQGAFLGILGISVLAMTIYRLFVLQQPGAELMGILGIVALGVNVAAVVVLLPHRQGDANVRAIWLFSRNDAIGNVAVVTAAGLVAWTQTPWPDLVVAIVIASLFLQSAYSIIRDARQDFATARRIVPR